MIRMFRKIWLDTLAPNGKYGFNRMVAFTTFWPWLVLCCYGYFEYPALSMEILFLMSGVVLGSKAINSFDKLKSNVNNPGTGNQQE